MNTSYYGDKLIATRTSRNGRRLYFQAFESGHEMLGAVDQAIELDFDPERTGSAATVEAEKRKALDSLIQHGRYIGYGGQWIRETVATDDQLTFWENVRREQLALWKVGAYLCTGVRDREVGIDVYEVAIGSKSAETMYQATLEQLPPRARFVTELMVKLWKRIPTDDDGHFNGYVTREEATELQRMDLYQPGHSQYRFSIPNEDLSDYAQRDTLGRYHHEREQNPTESKNTRNLKPGDAVMITSPITRTPYVVTVAALDSPNRHCFTTSTGLSVSYRRVVKAVEASESPETNGGEQ